MNEKTVYKFIFVILVYRNTDDLIECIDSIKNHVKSYRIIIVNAFYDDVTYQIVKEIAKDNDCDFINIENKGYSFGNNRGIEYADNHYNYDWIIISNPDIIVKNFDSKIFDEAKFDILAPKITAADGRQQNPMMFRKCALSEKLIYNGLKKQCKSLFYWGIAITKFTRAIAIAYNKLIRRNQYRIYCAHGSFVALSNHTVKTLFPVYDENMFLFGEEGVLAYKAAKAELKCFYSSQISIYHKEDGSMKLSNLSINNELKKSNIYFFENYRLKNK